jgi:Tol biopolymer transport system component
LSSAVLMWSSKAGASEGVRAEAQSKRADRQRCHTSAASRGTPAVVTTSNVDGSGLRRITSWGFPDADDGGSWSPDGRWILFSGRGEGGSLYVVHPNGSGLARVPLETATFSRAHDPSWSPDGTKIIFNLFTATSPGTEQEGIYTANADGSGVQQITNNPEFPESRDSYPDWRTHPLAT